MSALVVIQCPACQTRFRLADEKIGPHGVQVRCSKCAHTFPVKREEAASSRAPSGMPPMQSPPVQAQDETQSFPTRAPAPAKQLEPGAASPFNAAPASNPFAPPAPAANPFAPPPSPPAANPFAPPPSPAAANPFAAPPSSPAPPQNPFAPPAAPSGPAGWPGAGPPAAPAWPGANGGAPAGLGPSGLPAGIPDPFAEMADGNVPPGVSMGGLPGGADLPGDPFGAITGGAPPPMPMGGSEQSPELDPSVRAALLGGAPNDLSGDSGSNPGMVLTGEIAPAAPPPPARPAAEAPWQSPAKPGSAKERVGLAVEEKRKKERKKKGREVLSIKVDAPREPRAAYRLLMALFFTGAGLGAFASLTDGTLDPKRLDHARLSLITGAAPAVAPGVEGITLSGVDGGFLDTAPGRPRVFVARGIASNHGGETKGKLQVRGRLRDAAGKPVADSGQLWCGNTFRDDQLRDFRSERELTNAYTDVGDSNSNLKIPPGGHVPCIAVFFDAPQPTAVADFELEVVAAQPAG